MIYYPKFKDQLNKTLFDLYEKNYQDFNEGDVIYYCDMFFVKQTNDNSFDPNWKRIRNNKISQKIYNYTPREEK